MAFDVGPRYTFIDYLGSGSYGSVCRSADIFSHDRVAIKKTQSAFKNKQLAQRTWRELMILNHIRNENHKNIAHVLNAFVKRGMTCLDDLYLVLQLMPTDLDNLMTTTVLTSDQTCAYLLQILNGVHYLHSCSIMHRDIKPSNLLVDPDKSELKICDFGLSRAYSPSIHLPGFLTEYVVTRWYRAPEVMYNALAYSWAVDLWSVGCVFAEMLREVPASSIHRALFPARDYLSLMGLILNFVKPVTQIDLDAIFRENAYQFVANFMVENRMPLEARFPFARPEALDLMEKLLTFNPERRICAKAALAHEYLASYRQPEEEVISNQPLLENEVEEDLPEEVWQARTVELVKLFDGTELPHDE